MTKEHKISWMCPQCKSKQPKLDNTKTLIKQQAGCSKNNENELNDNNKEI